MKQTTIFFPFEPVPKGRPKFTKTGHAYTPSKTKDYEKKIAAFYKGSSKDCYDEAISVELVFNMPIPKSVSKKKHKQMADGKIKHIKKPDTDNLCKAFTDALNGIAYVDDSLITTIHACKQYADAENVGTRMTISEDIG